MAEMVTAPWTAEQVTNLNAFQVSGAFHEFTCGGDACPGVNGHHAALVATEAGWICPGCDYTQDWAHPFMADGSLTSAVDLACRYLPPYRTTSTPHPPNPPNPAAACAIYVTTDGYLWLECFADDPEAEHGDAITQLDAGDKWEDLVAKVEAHRAEHHPVVVAGGGGTENGDPT